PQLTETPWKTMADVGYIRTRFLENIRGNLLQGGIGRQFLWATCQRVHIDRELHSFPAQNVDIGTKQHSIWASPPLQRRIHRGRKLQKLQFMKMRRELAV